MHQGDGKADQTDGLHPIESDHLPTEKRNGHWRGDVGLGSAA